MSTSIPKYILLPESATNVDAVAGLESGSMFDTDHLLGVEVKLLNTKSPLVFHRLFKGLRLLPPVLVEDFFDPFHESEPHQSQIEHF